MKRAAALITMALILLTASPLFGEDSSSQAGAMTGFYEEIVTAAVGQDLSVTLSTIDVTIAGKLIEVYKDGIMIETIFKEQIFVARDAIAFIKFNKKGSKK